MKKLLLVVLLAGLTLPALAYTENPDYAPPGYMPEGITNPPLPVEALGSFSWQGRQAYPTAVYRAAGCTDSTFVYVFGGQSPVVNTCYRYNPATDSWTQLASMPTGVANAPAVYCNGKIYVIGGYTSSGSYSNATQIYTIASNSWTTGATCPVTSSGGTGASIGTDSVFFFYQGVARRYQISTNSWATRTSCGNSNVGFYSGATTYNNMIYVCAGWYSGTPTMMYNPSTGGWTSYAATSKTRNWPVVTAVNGMIYVCGGGNGWGAGEKTPEYFDPANPGLGWRNETDMLYAQNCPASPGGVVLYGGYRWIHVVTGYTGSASMDSHERGRAVYNDMGVEKIRTPGSTVPSNSSVAIKVKVRNYGANPNWAPVTFRVVRSGSDVYNQTVNSPTIPPQDSADVTFPNWTSGAAGITYDLITYTNLARDEDRTNDTCKGQVTTVAGIDVSTEDVQITPVPVKVGADELITGTFQNNGALPADFYANVKVYFGTKLVFYDSKTSSVGLGEMVNVTFSAWKPESIGTHRISVYCEADGDEFTDNDERSIYINVLAVGDAGVTAIGIPPSVVSGQPVIVSVKAKNFTADPLTGVPVYCQIVSGANLVYDQNTTADIPGNAEVDVPLPSWTPGDPGSYNVVAYTVLPGDIAPANDTSKMTVTVTPPGGVAEQPAPTAFALTSIQPNPFRNLTTVSYALPRSAHVRLAVYDVTGQLVRTLVDGTRGAGYWTAAWDGRDHTGSLLAPGIYFCQFEAGSYARTGKLTLVRP